MKRASAAATVVAFVALAIAAPAHAAPIEFEQEVIDLNLNYPGNLNLTGNLSVNFTTAGGPPYESNSMFALNGAQLTDLVSVVGVIDDYDPSTKSFEQVTYPTPQLGGPNYGLPHLTAQNILLNGVPAISGSAVCSGDCISPVPLPSSFPLFASALAAIGGFGWWKRQRNGAA